MSALGTVSTMSLAAISDTAFLWSISDMAVVPHGLHDFKITLRAVFDGVLELVLRVRLAKEVRAFDKQRFHFVGNGIACRVEHAQVRPKRDGLVRKFAPAKDRRFEIDIGKKCVDVLRGTQESKAPRRRRWPKVSRGPSLGSSSPRPFRG